MRAAVFTFLVTLAVVGCRPSDNRTEVVIWHQKTGGERTFFESLVERYNSQQPDHYISTLYRENEELRNLFVIASVGGSGPDLVFGPSDNVAIYALTGSILPLDDLVEPEFLDQFNDDGVIEWEGRPWMVADQVGNHLMFVYNKRLMPDPPETISEMVEVLRGLTIDENGDGFTDQYGLTWNYTEPFFFVPFLTCHGGSLMDDEGNPTLDTQATVDAIQLILDLRDKYGVIPPSTDYDTAETLFKEQRSGAIINGPWSWSGYTRSGVDYGLALIPRLDSSGKWCASFVSSKGYSVNVNLRDEKRDIVRNVLMYLSGPAVQEEMAIELSTIPTIDAVRELENVLANETLRRSLEQVEVSPSMPTTPRLRQVWDGMRGPYQLVMNGAVSAEEGAAMMQKEVEKRINDTFL